MFKQKQKKIKFWMLIFFVGAFFFALGQGEVQAGVNRVQTKTLTPNPSHPHLGTYDDFRGGIADQTIKQSIDKICALANKGVAATPLSYQCAASGDQQSRSNGSWMHLNQPVPSGGAWCENNGVEWVDCDDTPICFSTPQSISTSTLTPDPVDPHIGTYDDFRMEAGQTPAQAVAGVCALAGKDAAASPLEYNCATSGDQQSRHNGSWMTVVQSNLMGGRGDCQGYGIDKVSCVDVVPTGTYYTCPNGGTLSGTTCSYGATSTCSNIGWVLMTYDPNNLFNNPSIPRDGGVKTPVLPGTNQYCEDLGYITVGKDYARWFWFLCASCSSYTCPSGGTLSGTTCTYPATQVAACTPPPSTLIKNAQFISYANVPASVTSGQVFTASITMKNTGDATWLQGDYRLSSNLGYSWGTTSIALTRNVAKGETYTFTQAFIAPTVTAAATYNFRWIMLAGFDSFATYFGQATPMQQINVTVTPPPSTVVNGACGTANNTTTYPAPSAPAALCSLGFASAVSTPDVWNWTCAGQYGGSDASCSAKCDPDYQAYDCISVPAASCNQSNAGKTIVTTTARCNGMAPANSCTSPDLLTVQDCITAGETCPADTTTTCPAPLKIDSWKEVAP